MQYCINLCKYGVLTTELEQMLEVMIQQQCDGSMYGKHERLPDAHLARA